LLTGASKRYPTLILREKLNKELDDILREQVIERERAARYLLEPTPEEKKAAAKAEARRLRIKEARAGARTGGAIDNIESSDSEEEEMEVNNPTAVLESASSSSTAVSAVVAAMNKNGAAGGGGGGNKNKKSNQKENVQVSEQSALSMIRDSEGRVNRKETVRRWQYKEKLRKTQRSKTVGLAEAHGEGYCAACQRDGCIWKATCDMKSVNERREIITSELRFARVQRDSRAVESYVPLSAMRGGSTKFYLKDLIYELEKEDELLGAYLKLNLVDKELHDTYATSAEYVEVTSVHGYRSLMWIGEAEQALSKIRNSIIATTLVSEIIDDMLEDMVEGWAFGEKESMYTVAGYVPSVKADGVVRAGGDQARASKEIEKNRAAEEASRQEGEVFDHEATGSPRQKQEAVEESAQMRLFREDAERKLKDKDQHMDETETSLRFGSFLLALHYFRAMNMIAREKASWRGKDTRMDGPVVRPVTLERKEMIAEQKAVEYRRLELARVLKRAKAGERSMSTRTEAERTRLAKVFLASEKAERDKKKSCIAFQRLYRGHIGRRAARRWGAKKAELDAMLALMNAAATSLQRCFRGFVGRMAAAEARAEMAEFIAMMRLEEAAADEEDFWRNNHLRRWQRDWRVFWDTSKAVLSNSEALKFNTRKHKLPVREEQ